MADKHIQTEVGTMQFDEMRDALRHPGIGAIFAGGRFWRKDEMLARLDGESVETLRQAEKRFRSEGHSRREAERLAAEHLQKNKDGDDMARNENLVEAIEAMGNESREWMERNEKLIDRHERGFKNIEAAMQKISRLSLGNPNSSAFPEGKSERVKIFAKFLRTGDGREYKAEMNTTVDSDGGYAVPEEIDKIVSSVAMNINVLRKLATIVTCGTPDWNKLFVTSRAAAEWVDEADARAATGTPTLAALRPYWGELHASPVASQYLIDDAFFSIAEWLGEEVGKSFGEAESLAFLAGTGVKQPRGITNYPSTNEVDGVRAYGTLQFVISADANGFIVPTATASPADALINMIYATRSAYRQNASFLMNRKTLGLLMKFKDSVNGLPIWINAISAGQPSSIFGYPVYESEDMPDVSAGNFPVIFGDFRSGYLIAERPFGTRVLVDPYTGKPNTTYYTTRRIGGMCVDTNALKLLKIAAA